MGVIYYWCIYADLLTKKVDKKCRAPNKLLLLSLSLFLWSSICNFLGSILKNRKLAIRTTMANHVMECRAYWMKVKHTRPFSVECWCFIKPILYPTSHLFYFDGTSYSCKHYHTHKNWDKSCYVMSSNKGN